MVTHGGRFKRSKGRSIDVTWVNKVLQDTHLNAIQPPCGSEVYGGKPMISTCLYRRLTHSQRCSMFTPRIKHHALKPQPLQPLPQSSTSSPRARVASTRTMWHSLPLSLSLSSLVQIHSWFSPERRQIQANKVRIYNLIISLLFHLMILDYFFL